ncbi:substrate-binding domain-containing protein [Phytohabitans kaempferiae]|uniref:Substrate-binding domain-containing protein n=1 Tax=Phytohabitans kaempferiae TaxID=1620943 RepID=A0ABV6M9R8_9ACTN
MLTGVARLTVIPRRTAPPAQVDGEAHVLGLVAFDTALLGPTWTVRAIERAARHAGHSLAVARASSLDGGSVTGAIASLRARGVEGILAVTPTDSALAALERVAPDAPLVAVGVGDADGVPMVGVDNIAGAAMVTRHLLDLGHDTVHHISGPVGWPEARERLAGWRAALRQVGAVEGRLLPGDWGVRSGFEAGRRIAADRDVTAIFCANDQMALGALRALHLAGRAVPGEVSVVGFDDIPEAPFLRPPLTTVRQDFAAVGRAGVDLLVRRIVADSAATPPGGAAPRGRVRFVPALVVRDSSAPAM